MTTEQPDLLTDLQKAHEAVRVHFSELTGVPLGDPERRHLVARLTDELMCHFGIEEQFLHPFAREVLSDGRSVLGPELAAHRTIEALLADLRFTSASSGVFDRLVAHLMEETTRHFSEEESRLFPALRATVPAEDLEGLARQAREALDRPAVHPRPQPPAVKPPDHLPPPEPSLTERIKDFLTPG